VHLTGTNRIAVHIQGILQFNIIKARHHYQFSHKL